jgi:hypothetical protein
MGASVLSQAATGQPLYDHDNGPLTGFFGIPDSTEGALFVPAGRSAWDAVLLTSSHAVSDVGPEENLLFDGETTRFEFRYRHGLGDRAEFGIELPYVWHESGGLDDLIDNWHDWFGLPGGNRTARPVNELQYLYEDSTGTQLDISNNANGIGDMRLFAGWHLYRGSGHNVALRVGAKLPTGDSETLLGSGGFDYSLGIAGNLDQVFGVEGLTAFYRFHGIGIGEPDLLPDRYREFVGQASLGVGYAINHRVELRLQGALRSALYRSDVEPLGSESGTLTFGGHIRLTEGLAMTLAVSEDVIVESAPDVSFQVALRYTPR